jgi:Flp pilus assembly CpaE family ATPase
LAKIYAVVGASGAVGTSTFAAALARSIHLNSTALVDLQFAGGIDVTVGIEQMNGVRWSDMLKHQIQPEVLLSKMPKWHDISVLSNKYEEPYFISFDKVFYIIKQLSAIVTDIVLDVPRLLMSDRSLLELLDGLVIIVPRSVSGVSNALAIIQALKGFEIPLQIVTTREHLARKSKLIPTSSIEQLLGVSPVGELRFELKIAAELELGLGPRPNKRSNLFKLVELLKFTGGRNGGHNDE